MAKFGRENTRASKLTPAMVNEMRRIYAEGRKTQGQLARDFGISAVQVGRIVRWESWTDMPEIVTGNEMEASLSRLADVQRERDLTTRLAEEVKAIRKEQTPGETKGDKLLEELSGDTLTRYKRMMGEE